MVVFNYRPVKITYNTQSEVSMSQRADYGAMITWMPRYRALNLDFTLNIIYRGLTTLSVGFT